MVDSTLVVWFDGQGEAALRLFLIPVDIMNDYGVCDGVFLNFTEDTEPDTELQRTHRVEHLAYLLGTEPCFGPIPTLSSFLQLAAIRDAEKGVPKESDTDTGEFTAALAPWAKYECKHSRVPVVARSFIRCGWLP